MNKLEKIVAAGFLAGIGFLAADRAMAQSQPTTLVLKNGTAYVLNDKTDVCKENDVISRRRYNLAKDSFATGQLNSALGEIQSAIDLRGNGQCPKLTVDQTWRDLHTKIYKAQIEKIVDEIKEINYDGRRHATNVELLHKMDLLLNEIFAYNKHIKDAKVYAMMACRTTSMKNRKKYYHKSLFLDKDAAIEFYQSFLGQDWKEQLKL